MKPTNLLLSIPFFLITVSLENCKTQKCCVDFDKSPFLHGTTFAKWNDLIYASCNYTVKTDSLYLSGTGYFNFARAENSPAVFGSGNVLNTNNVTLHFINTSTIGQVVITFDYLDMGGRENLTVNGILYSGELSAAPPTLGGAVVSVTATAIPLPAVGNKGTVTIKGQIKEFNIGGQEFYLDNICFK